MTYENMKKHLEMALASGDKRRIEMYQARVDLYESRMSKPEVKESSKKKS